MGPEFIDHRANTLEKVLEAIAKKRSPEIDVTMCIPRRKLVVQHNGLAGVVFGIGLGYLGTLAINNFIGSSTTPEISVALIVFALLGSFVIGSVSGIAPALRAAHQNPVEALRG